ncbi:MAG: hypothetical protein Q4C06_08725, partial [Bacillota bacterium]|nr:hypothetical protein [Bacillota bacterium]
RFVKKVLRDDRKNSLYRVEFGHNVCEKIQHSERSVGHLCPYGLVLVVFVQNMQFLTVDFGWF